jgi:hypothetical protein
VPNGAELLVLEKTLVLMFLLAEAHFMVVLEAVAAELPLVAVLLALEGRQAVLGAQAARM